MKSIESHRCGILLTRRDLLRNLTQSSLIGSRYPRQNERFFNGPSFALYSGV
jgi:hypothetical protein